MDEQPDAQSWIIRHFWMANSIGAKGDDLALVMRRVTVAHRQVEAVYRSRLRFVERFEIDLERWQVQAVRMDGEPITWTSEVVNALIEDNSTTVAELVVFFQSMDTHCGR